MSTKLKAGLIIAACLVLIGLGYALASWRHSAWIAGYDEREQQRMQQIAANEAEQNKLRGENKALREHVAELSAQDEAMKAIIDQRGGAIAAEAKNLEKISDDLKNNQAVISNPTDRCVHCRAFSDELLRARKIAKPLACKDECPGANQ